MARCFRLPDVKGERLEVIVRIEGERSHPAVDIGDEAALRVFLEVSLENGHRFLLRRGPLLGRHVVAAGTNQGAAAKEEKSRLGSWVIRELLDDPLEPRAAILPVSRIESDRAALVEE